MDSMFTGIVTRTGVLAEVRPRGGALSLEVVLEGGAAAASGDTWEDLVVGESIAVDGVCLTLVSAAPERLRFDVIPETAERTTLGARRPGARVNLERSLRIGARLGGHFVFGHVDSTGEVAAVREMDGQRWLEITTRGDSDFAAVRKGSVAVNGVSLTVARVERDRFAVGLIPHTLAITSLGSLAIGNLVNLEMDPLGRWVKHLLAAEWEERSART